MEVNEMKWYVIPRDKKEGCKIIFSGTYAECNAHVEKMWGNDFLRQPIKGEGTVVSENGLKIRKSRMAK
ncbi:MAG: hypothetical protein PHS33_08765 [Candidatus Omnitrophica bacterium]|nr:hypothetical protein [Candidatus Omnitrophota bacterium]MDD5219827.1 hypothetical protein [Candidatus Bipolaricaulis sp.]